MSNHFTQEEVRDRHIEQLGDKLGPLFHELWYELALLHFKWHEFVQLFGTKESRVEILNKSAPHFFNIVQKSLLDDVLLHIARLTDPPKSCGKDNLTLQRLPPLIADKQLSEEVATLIAQAKDKSNFCRDRRNRSLAHHDLLLALNELAEPLSSASRKQIDEALKSLAAVMNAINLRFTNGTVAFDFISSPSGSALSMLRTLSEGLKAREEMQKRHKKGEYREDDFKVTDL